MIPTLQAGVLPTWGGGSLRAHVSSWHAAGCRYKVSSFVQSVAGVETGSRASESYVKISLLVDLGPTERSREVLNSGRFIRLFEDPQTHTSSVYFWPQLSVLGELKARSINMILSLTPLYEEEGGWAVQMLPLNPLPFVCMVFGLLPKVGIKPNTSLLINVGVIIFC